MMKHRPKLYLFATVIFSAIGCAAESGDAILDEEPAETATATAAACVVPSVDIDRSLFVSPTTAAEQADLRARFAVSRIMQQILASSGAPRPASGTLLWQRWWDTQNARARRPVPR